MTACSEGRETQDGAFAQWTMDDSEGLRETGVLTHTMIGVSFEQDAQLRLEASKADEKSVKTACSTGQRERDVLTQLTQTGTCVRAKPGGSAPP